jgi:hypothetical protein
MPAEFPPFRLKRKADRWSPSLTRPPARRIKSITRVEDEDSTCISVAADDGLYLTRHHIVTHNTTIVLTAIADLLNNFLIRGALVIAPRRVAETVWEAEARAWAHTAHLKVCVLRGKAKKVLMRELLRPYDIWVINYESLPWLYNAIHTLFLRQGHYPPFDMLVFDEITRVKHPTGARIGPWHAKSNGTNLLDFFPRKVGLTGTPAPNGLLDLFGQYLALDNGKRLGVDFQDYKRQYFEEDPYRRKTWLRKGAKEDIERRIADITVSMAVDDYLVLPPYIINDIWVDLPSKARAQYDELEKEMFVELDSGGLEVFNAAALTAKCRQMANGIVRGGPDNPDILHPVHDAKLEALDEVMEEAAGQGVLISYLFRPDMERILARYKKQFTMAYLGPGVNDTEARQIVDDWNKGLIEGLITHPLSAGHGLNLQHGGHQIVWFGLSYNLEEYLQMNARLRRPGQTSERVIIHRLLARQTVDCTTAEVLAQKATDQESLREAMKRYQTQRGWF